MTTDFVLFDDDCPPCRSLAAWGAARAGDSGLRFRSWQDFAAAEGDARPADRLRVLADGAMLEGEAAWEHLVARHPSFQQLTWMARRIGLARPEAETGKALMRTGAIVRRLCLRCPRS